MQLKHRLLELLHPEQGAGFDRAKLLHKLVQQPSQLTHTMTQRIPRMIQQTRLQLAATILFLGSLATTNAHPGHRFADHGAAHVFSSPYHLALLAFAGVVLFVAGRLAQRTLPRRLLQAGGLAALALTAALWGMRA